MDFVFANQNGLVLDVNRMSMNVKQGRITVVGGYAGIRMEVSNVTARTDLFPEQMAVVSKV